MKEVEELFIDKPALTAFPIFDNHLTDAEYLRLVLRIKARCNSEVKQEERDDNYKTEFFFSGTVVEGEYVDDLFHIMRASDMYTFTVLKRRPQLVRLTCYRLKREEKTDSF